MSRIVAILPLMPKQTQLIAGGLVVAAIVAVIAFTQLSKSPKTNVAQEITTPKEESGIRGSIKSLLGVGKNVSCSVKYPESAGDGKIYVAGDRVRGDFTLMIDNKEMESHMIVDREFGYFWSGTQGTKMKIDETEKTASPLPEGQEQTQDIDKEVDLNCSSWSVDNSKFTIPTNVQFTDMTEIMQKMQQQSGGSGTPKIDSSYCNQITDPAAKAACLDAASGN